MVELRLTKCVVRGWRRSDATSLARHANNRAVWRNLMDRFPHPYTAEDARRWLEEPAPRVSGLHLAIEVEGEAAGGIGLEPMTDIHRRSAKIGYWLGETYWSRGIMTEAVAAVTEYGLQALELLRLEAPVFEWNHASMRVLEKCGYSCESRQRRAGVKDGQVLDLHLYVRLAEPAEPRRIAELSHPIEDGMITYPGLPGPRIGDHLSREASRAHYAPGTEFQIGRIEMVANTGTYLDAPFHRWPEGGDLAQLPLERCADLEGVVVRATGARDGGAALVGIDSINIDDRSDPRRPAHTILLQAGIPIVEHLTGLEQLPERGFRFTAAPAPVARMGSFPVRAFAVLAP